MTEFFGRRGELLNAAVLTSTASRCARNMEARYYKSVNVGRGAAAILKPKRRTYRNSLYIGPPLERVLPRRYRQNFLVALGMVERRAPSPRAGYIVVGSTCARRISMFRNSVGIRPLSHLPPLSANYRLPFFPNVVPKLSFSFVGSRIRNANQPPVPLRFCLFA